MCDSSEFQYSSRGGGTAPFAPSVYALVKVQTPLENKNKGLANLSLWYRLNSVWEQLNRFSKYMDCPWRGCLRVVQGYQFDQVLYLRILIYSQINAARTTPLFPLTAPPLPPHLYPTSSQFQVQPQAPTTVSHITWECAKGLATKYDTLDTTEF